MSAVDRIMDVIHEYTHLERDEVDFQALRTGISRALNSPVTGTETHLGPEVADTPAVQFRGLAPEGMHVLVTIWDDGALMQRALDTAGVVPMAEVSVSHGGSWAAPVYLEQIR